MKRKRAIKLLMSLEGSGERTTARKFLDLAHEKGIKTNIDAFCAGLSGVIEAASANGDIKTYFRCVLVSFRIGKSRNGKIRRMA